MKERTLVATDFAELELRALARPDLAEGADMLAGDHFQPQPRLDAPPGIITNRKARRAKAAILRTRKCDSL